MDPARQRQRITEGTADNRPTDDVLLRQEGPLAGQARRRHHAGNPGKVARPYCQVTAAYNQGAGRAARAPILA